MGFLTQWKMYLDALPQDPSMKSFRKLDPTVFEKVKFFRITNYRICAFILLDVGGTIGSIV